jgi:tetratricopeptide (TPR) repeat protein
MPNLSVTRTLALVVFPCLLISTCSTVNKNLTKQTSVQSRKSLAVGDFQKALDRFKEAYKKNRHDEELAANYAQTAEEIKRAADRVLGQRDYARAGNIYRVLLSNYADFGAFAAKLTFNKSSLETALKHCRISIVQSQAQQALEAGNFAKVLDTYQAAFRENPGDADLTAKYRGAVNDINAVGDRALGDKDFALAGRVSAFLLKNFPSFEGLRPPVAFSRGTLSEAIAICRDGLTKAGLEEYRKGKLAKAIAVWEDLLAFDPDNAEIKKAVNTVRIQLNEIIKKK